MPKRKRNIVYISGSRADYGLMRNTLFSIAKNPKLELEIIATGMHLMPEFGSTVREIKKDGFKIHMLKAVFRYDDRASMAAFIGECISQLVVQFKRIKPDVLLLLGDRPEMLAGAVAGAYLSIPVVHIHGGDVSSTIDDSTRHAITKLAHVHLAATKKSAQRIINMGEEPWRVHVTGAPGVEGLENKIQTSKEVARKFSVDIKKHLLLVVQHPVTAEIKDSKEHMQHTLEAIQELGFQSVVVYPNADAGGRQMIQVIKQYQKFPFIKTYKSISREDFLGLMGIASVMVGNSSSGIIEAPSFHLPVVNIGSRQAGRECAGNTIEVGYKKQEIKKAIQKALYDKTFLAKVKRIKNPYVRSHTSRLISKALENVVVNETLLVKKLTY